MKLLNALAGLFDLNRDQLEWLKIIALPLMVFDHFVTMVDENSLWRMPGRAVFPVFAFLVVYNLLNRTRDQEKYILRLCVTGLVAQPFYSLALSHALLPLNVLFTLSLGSLFVLLFDKWRSFEGRHFAYCLVLPLAAVVLLLLACAVEFNVMGLLLMLAFYFFLRTGQFAGIGLIVLALMFTNVFWSDFMMVGGLLFLCLLTLVKQLEVVPLRTNRWFFYLFYPLHLMVLRLLMG